MKWPWSKPPAKLWYEERGYIRLPADTKVSLVLWNAEAQVDVIVDVSKTGVTVFTNQGTFLNKTLGVICVYKL